MRYSNDIPVAMAFALVLSPVCLHSINDLVITAFAQEVTDSSEGIIMIGTNVKGVYTSIKQSSDSPSTFLPWDYYDYSFREIRNAGMNHVRYVFYWESYERDPESFMNEIDLVAQTADKWGVGVIYDNHQFHTSSWLNEDRGTGFPFSLFSQDPAYVFDGGGGVRYQPAIKWWTNWWNRNVTDSTGRDGWSLQAEFLKKIVSVVDVHPSTIGYEILNEPQIHSEDQWEKIGEYNTYMTKELRTVTQKKIVYSMQIPVDFSGSVGSKVITTAEDLVKMLPENENNAIFKVTTYGVPYSTGYQGEKFDVFLQAAEIAGIPLYVGEWNYVERDRVLNLEGNTQFIINESTSDLNQTQVYDFIKTFDERKVWGWAFWNWNYRDHDIANFNLVELTDNGEITPTKYFQYLKNGVARQYGNMTLPQPSNPDRIVDEPSAFILTAFVEEKGYSISGHSRNVTISSYSIEPEFNSINLKLDKGNDTGQGGFVELTLPTKVIAGIHRIGYGDGELQYQTIAERPSSTTLLLQIPSGVATSADSIEISGATVIPEFSTLALLGILVISLATAIGFGRQFAYKNHG